MNKTNFIKKQPESTPCGVRRRRENHARLCLARAGNCDLILNTLTKLASAASEAANRQRRHSAAVLIDSDVL